MPRKIIRPREAWTRMGIGETKYYEMRKQGLLSRVVRLGPQAVGHFEDEFDKALEALAERDGALVRRHLKHGDAEIFSHPRNLNYNAQKFSTRACAH
jgi:predicted DNA-binding transcriptional regulator AlpA